MAPRSLTRNSTCVASASYDDDTQMLDISFVEGGSHRYYGVSQDLAEGLANASSKGAYFNRSIRPLDAGKHSGGFRGGRKLR
jgi:hypothetical protein